MKTVKNPKFKKIILKVDPYAGAASLAIGGVPEGYVFVSMKRVGTRATILYQRIDP